MDHGYQESIERTEQYISRAKEASCRNETGKIAPIQVTIKFDGPIYNATEIAKAEKCLKDNPNFKSVYINPDLIQVQQIHLNRLIKERIQKAIQSLTFVMEYAVINWLKSKTLSNHKNIN